MECAHTTKDQGRQAPLLSDDDDDDDERSTRAPTQEAERERERRPARRPDRSFANFAAPQWASGWGAFSLCFLLPLPPFVSQSAIRITPPRLIRVDGWSASCNSIDSFPIPHATPQEGEEGVGSDRGSQKYPSFDLSPPLARTHPIPFIAQPTHARGFKTGTCAGPDRQLARSSRPQFGCRRGGSGAISLFGFVRAGGEAHVHMRAHASRALFGGLTGGGRVEARSPPRSNPPYALHTLGRLVYLIWQIP